MEAVLPWLFCLKCAHCSLLYHVSRFLAEEDIRPDSEKVTAYCSA